MCGASHYRSPCWKWHITAANNSVCADISKNVAAPVMLIPFTQLIFVVDGHCQHQPPSFIPENVNKCVPIKKVTNVSSTSSITAKTSPAEVSPAKAPPTNEPFIVYVPVNGPPFDVDDQNPQDNEGLGESADREGIVWGRWIGCVGVGGGHESGYERKGGQEGGREG